MKLGIALPQLGNWATPENIITISQKAEELGYNSVWVQERLLFPLNPKKSYPGTPDGSLPEGYKYVLDPIISLSYAAANTKNIRIGTSIINVVYHTPAVLAKQLATLDHISGGRLDFGVGLGWSEDEYETTNVEFKNRGDRIDEFLKCLVILWTEDEPEFNGTYYKVPRSTVNPKPLQKPYPVITIGGFSPRTFVRAVTLGDGYNGFTMPFDEMEGVIDTLRKSADSHNRDFGELQIVCRSVPAIMDESPGGERTPLAGTPDEIKEDILRYDELGVSEIIFEFNFDPEITVERMSDYMEMLAPS